VNLSVRGLRAGYDGKEVLGGIDIDFAPGTITCILGSSGCGKSTLLDVLAGLCTAWAGEVIRSGNVAYCFQEPRLLPWMTALENVAYVLPRDIGRTDRAARARAAMEQVGLAQATEDYPSDLSGGMAQRTSLARALVVDAPIVLLDEPLSAVDPGLRGLLIDVLSRGRDARTTVIATHDLQSAEALGDRIFLLAGNPATGRSLTRAELGSLDWDGDN
jgi:ABC-type nitrate/sulfonate/bicarbonate transport system ATPase subunit